jgi:hypothetical protein
MSDMDFVFNYRAVVPEWPVKEIPYNVHVQRRGSLAWIAKSPKARKD